MDLGVAAKPDYFDRKAQRFAEKLRCSGKRFERARLFSRAGNQSKRLTARLKAVPFQNIRRQRVFRSLHGKLGQLGRGNGPRPLAAEGLDIWGRRRGHGIELARPSGAATGHDNAAVGFLQLAGLAFDLIDLSRTELSVKLP
jgi:hypothetical protein